MEAISKLAIDGSGGFAVFTLHGGFADTENGGEVIADSGGDFFGDVFFGFVEDVATFGMANNGIVNEATKLRHGCLAGECAIVAPIEILSSKLELAAVDL